MHTTANHPWLTADRGWLPAGQLRPGEPLVTLAGAAAAASAGSATSTAGTAAPTMQAVVLGAVVVPGAAPMWDLTLDQVHTFGVGAGQWVVHNCPPEGGAGGGASGGANPSARVWDRVTAQEPDRLGTNIPQRFLLQAGEDTYEVVPNATRHMGEYLTREGTAGLNTRLRATYMLDSFARAVDEAVPSLQPGRNFVEAGGWELGIDTADNHIFHARMI